MCIRDRCVIAIIESININTLKLLQLSVGLTTPHSSKHYWMLSELCKLWVGSSRFMIANLFSSQKVKCENVSLPFIDDMWLCGYVL